MVKCDEGSTSFNLSQQFNAVRGNPAQDDEISAKWPFPDAKPLISNLAKCLTGTIFFYFIFLPGDY